VPIAEFKAHAARAAIARAVKPVSTLRDTLGEAERNQILRALEQSQRRRRPAGHETFDAPVPHAEAGHPDRAYWGVATTRGPGQVNDPNPPGGLAQLAPGAQNRIGTVNPIPRPS